MDFVVDRVSEDSYYENLLLGLPKILGQYLTSEILKYIYFVSISEDFPCVSETYLNRSLPVQHNIICNWEQKYSVLLPEDLRSFYGSTDGLFFSYKYNMAGTSDTMNYKFHFDNLIHPIRFNLKKFPKSHFSVKILNLLQIVMTNKH